MNYGRACPDPYKIGCDAPSVSMMLCHRLVETPFYCALPGQPSSKFDVESMTIFMCSDCMYWESDHDWEKEPNGPRLPAHVTRFERVV